MAEGQGEQRDINIEAIINNAIARYVREHPPERGPAGPLGEPGDAKPAGQDGLNGNKNGNRFLSSDVGFFDPFYDGKSINTRLGIEHTGKETYFRNITVFINRIKDVARVKGTELLQNNLQIYLRGEALEQYTCQLTDNEKRLLSYGINVDEWSKALLERFGPTKASGITTIIRERYILNDAMRYREPREYTMVIIRAAQIAKLGDVYNQLDIIWNSLDIEFQSDIDSPTVQTTLNQFLTSIDIRKQQWWTKASRMTKHQNPNPSTTHRALNPPQNRGNSSQYNNQAKANRFSGRPQQAPPYQKNYQAYNQYQNRPYENRQPAYTNAGPTFSRDQQQTLPAPPIPKQITANLNQAYQ